MPDGQVDTIWTFNLSEHPIQYLLCKTRPKDHFTAFLFNSITYETCTQHRRIFTAFRSMPVERSPEKGPWNRY